MTLTESRRRWARRPVRNTKTLRIELERDHLADLVRIADAHNSTPERIAAQLVRAGLIARETGL